MYVSPALPRLLIPQTMVMDVGRSGARSPNTKQDSVSQFASEGLHLNPTQSSECKWKVETGNLKEAYKVYGLYSIVRERERDKESPHQQHKLTAFFPTPNTKLNCTHI